MKKVLSGILLMVLIIVLTGGFLVFKRYNENPEQIVPYPYTFKTQAQSIKLDAPILIIGDRMGVYFAKFKENLAETISINLSKPIKIQSLAKEGHGLHRTLHELKSLTQWPQILIYQGASEEFNEVKFVQNEIPKIRENFQLFKDEKIETLLILEPKLSRFIYTPVKLISLDENPIKKLSSLDYNSRLETELLLFKEELIDLVKMSRSRNSLLILTTTPINLNIPPKAVCDFATTTDIEGEIINLKDLKEKDLKTAYNKSSKLISQYAGNADLYYLHGQISQNIGNKEESVSSFLKSSAYDCEPWRATEIHNSIIRKVAEENQVLLFDFAKLVEKDFGENTTFFDEIYPQNLYYDKGMEQLGLVIKSILKL